MRRPGQIVTRTMLLEDVWNFKFMAQTNVVDVQIGNLRRKLDPADARQKPVTYERNLHSIFARCARSSANGCARDAPCHTCKCGQHAIDLFARVFGRHRHA